MSKNGDAGKMNFQVPGIEQLEKRAGERNQKTAGKWFVWNRF